MIDSVHDTAAATRAGGARPTRKTSAKAGPTEPKLPTMRMRTQRFRFYPTSEQDAALTGYLAAASDLYNAALAQRRYFYSRAEAECERRRPWHPLDGDQRPGPVKHWVTDAQKYVPIPAPKGISLYDQTPAVKEVREFCPSGMPALVMAEVLQRVDRTFRAFFARAAAGKAGYPRFRGPDRYDSLTFGLTAPSRPPAERGEEWLAEHADELAQCIQHIEARASRGAKPAGVTGKELATLVGCTEGVARSLRVLALTQLGYEVPAGVTVGAGELRADGLRLTGVGLIGFERHTKRRGLRLHREIPDDAVARSAIVRRSCGRWYVSIAFEMPPVPPRVDDDRPEVGVDMGVVQWATLSTGETIDGPEPGRKTRRRRGQPRPRPPKDGRRLALLHRKRSRREKVRTRGRYSKRHGKAVRELARAYSDAHELRKDHREQVTHRLAQRFSVVYVEDLREQRMMRSETGTVDAPNPESGRKRGLNRRIADAAWDAAHLRVGHKAEDAGGRLVKVPPMNTTRLCSVCGALAPGPVTGLEYHCTSCGSTLPRTYNSARNIENLGRAAQQLAGSDRGGARPSGGNGGG